MTKKHTCNPPVPNNTRKHPWQCAGCGRIFHVIVFPSGMTWWEETSGPWPKRKWWRFK
jgi:hypothetical protein